MTSEPKMDETALRDVHARIRQAIADLKAAGIEVPAALYQAAILLAQRRIIDVEERKS